jgi:hypothetical protein
MVATPYAVPSDVATRLGLDGFTTQENLQALALLDDVSEIMRARLPSLDIWIATGKTTEGLARAVACQLAMQAITVSSTGFGIRQEVHPEHSVTFTDAAAAGLDLTDAQISLLTPNVSEYPRAFSIRPGNDD